MNSQSSDALNGKPESKALSLQVMCVWAYTVRGESLLSIKEMGELDCRTNAASKKYGWPDLGRQSTSKGEIEIARNIAYFMLRHELSFRAAAFEYIASLEKGCRRVAVDSELDSAAADLLIAIELSKRVTSIPRFNSSGFSRVC